MATENNISNVNISTPQIGMHTDNHPMYQPKGTYRYALNSVIEKSDNIGLLSNEESNKHITSLPKGYIPIGSCSIGDNSTAIFSLSNDGKTSEIGILDKADIYKTIVNDETATHKLNFKIDKPIQAVYRLVRGCERTIYFTDDYNKPRYFNFDKLDNFKTSGDWNANLFNLQKSYSSIPIFKKLRVLNEGGTLLSGSYSIAIQYLDEQLNPTEWITTSDMVRIYVDKKTEFNQVSGSVNSDVDALNFPVTTKAIEINLGDLDNSFPFYRLAFIETTSGNGQVTRVTTSAQTPIKQTTFIYTGNNVTGVINKEELALFNNTINTAGSIEQIENRLLLANTKGKGADLCKLQRYASKINADCIVHQHKANVLYDYTTKEYMPANIKSPVQEIVGFMAGEIYSFGIIYIFKDNSLSPVFHIPGRSTNVPKNRVYSSGDVYPMSDDNILEQVKYDNSNSCSGKDYWGLDGEGKTLGGKNVRHHRFPFRSDINKSLVFDKTGNLDSNAIYYRIRIKLSGKIKLPDDENDQTYELELEYKIGSQTITETFEINTADYKGDDVDLDVNINFYSEYYENPINPNTVKITITDENNVSSVVTDGGTITALNLKLEVIPIKETKKVTDRIYTANVLGIRFSNIDIPNLGTGDNEIIGYYIVRNERTEQEKTILDNAVLVQCMKNHKYVSHGLLFPETGDPLDKYGYLEDTCFGMIHPEHKFNNKEFRNIDEIIVQGSYKKTDTKLGKINYPDVLEGSSYEEGKHKGKSGTDEDGWDLHIISRDNIVKYYKSPTEVVKVNNKIKEIFYLNGLESKQIEDGKKDVYNITTDNKIGIIHTDGKVPAFWGVNPTYVALKRNLASPYANFRILPYFKCTTNPVYFKDLPTDKKKRYTETYAGDSYIAPMKYVNSVFYDNRVATRPYKKRNNLFGAILFIVGVLALPFTGGASTLLIIGAYATIVGGWLLVMASGIKEAKFKKVWEEEYQKGLRKTTLDRWVKRFYGYKTYLGQEGLNGVPFGYNGSNIDKKARDGVEDDTIQWIGDCLSDIWIESSVNIGLRNGFASGDTPTYLNDIGLIEKGQDKPINCREFFKKYTEHQHDYTQPETVRDPVSSLEYHLFNKLTVTDLDPEIDKSKSEHAPRKYIGLALGEYYNVNPDYHKQAKEKWFYHLAQEYDCCSECRETFPHRIHYSEQSFQEELSDNYKIFLPNNYRDIDGETGVITNVFSIRNDLFIHTEEALWQVPRSHQERVTDQIVSFIGTGSYFEVPPRKIIDSNVGASAGSRHKWATLKTPQGVFFVSENQRKVYLFSGQLQPISDVGMSKWFFDNVGLQLDNYYYGLKGKKYLYSNNPQNKIGTGYLSVYDYEKERFILTKKDYSYNNMFYLNEDDEFYVVGNEVINYKNISDIIAEQEELGYLFEGVKDGELIFSKDIEEDGEINTGGVIIDEIETQEWDIDEEKEIIEDKNDVITETIVVTELGTEVKTIKGEVIKTADFNNKSWTLSFSMKNKSWTSFHSYQPNFYLHTANNFYSFTYEQVSEIFKHNFRNSNCVFYNKSKDFVIEYASVSSPIATRIWNGISFIVSIEDLNINHFTDKNNIFFDKLLLYNSRQCSGELDIVIKDEKLSPENYLYQQIDNTNPNEIIVDRNEKNWYVNNFRDIRIDYNTNLFQNINDYITPNIHIDKTLNTSVLNINKNWIQLEPFRDKYLIIRLIANKSQVDNTLKFHLSLDNETISNR